MPEHREDLIAQKALHNVLFSMNWGEPHAVTGATFPFHPTIMLGSCSDAAFHPHLVARTNTTGVMGRTRDLTNWTSGAAMSDGGAVAIDAFYADAPYNAFGDILAINSSGAKCYKSSDAGATWDAGVAVGATPTAIARHYGLNLVIVGGFNMIRTADSGPTTFTARTVPAAWATLTASKIIVPRSRDTGVGALILPAESSNHIAYSADGITWVDTTIATGKPIAGVWSEGHRAWFVLTSDGKVYRSAAPGSGWTLVVSLYNPSGFHYYNLAAFGYNFVICGTDVAATSNHQVGSIVVTSDFQNFYPITTTTDDGESGVAYFDHRIIVGHITGTNPYGLTVSASMRLPGL